VIARELDGVEVGAVLSGYNITNPIFADDIAVTTETEKNLQSAMNHIAQKGQRMGMGINTHQTKVQSIGPESVPVRVAIDGSQLKKVEKFTYLGGIISKHCTFEIDMQRR